MKDELRFKLFSEIVGNDERNSIKNYDSILKGSEAYKILSYNIIDARKSRTRKAKALVYSFDNLTFKPKDVKNAFKLEIMLNYLALHSFPEYYLNPLAISPNYQGEVNSIGDLYIDYPKGDRTINSIIESQEETLSEKKKSRNISNTAKTTCHPSSRNPLTPYRNPSSSNQTKKSSFCRNT